MSNMSYCRFENTARDLSDCRGALEELLSGEGGDAGMDGDLPLSDRELRAAQELIQTCLDIIRTTAECMDLSVADDEDGDKFETEVGDFIDIANVNAARRKAGETEGDAA